MVPAAESGGHQESDPVGQEGNPVGQADNSANRQSNGKPGQRPARQGQRRQGRGQQPGKPGASNPASQGPATRQARPVSQ
ncbi:hypothetical protein Ahu01nite_015840 [Winogradskya humida]|uniref:Uncharacterized protein n=1 Tax=Winogradskya humida TaxID=113566 RepID=A0ABQ3ZIV8_9ACTN|nr:hypothetical protein Ahu01nite_015840 [Actinoplanes humidus]